MKAINLRKFIHASAIAGGLSIAAAAGCGGNTDELDQSQSVATLTENNVDALCSLLEQDFSVVSETEEKTVTCTLAGIIVASQPNADQSCQEVSSECIDQNLFETSRSSLAQTSKQPLQA